MLRHLNAIEGGPLPRDAFAGLGLHVLQHSAGRNGKGAVDPAPVVNDHMGSLALEGCGASHIGDVFELVVLLPLPVESAQDLFQWDAGRFDGLELEVMVHRVAVHVEVADVINGEAQVLVAAVIGGRAVFQSIAPSILRHGTFPVCLELFSGVQLVLLSSEAAQCPASCRVGVVLMVPAHWNPPFSW